MGATFGGGSSQGSVFGGSGAGNFLSRLTTASAAIFMITSMTLAFLASTSGEDALAAYSKQQRAAALDKERLDQEAQNLSPDLPEGPAPESQNDNATEDGADPTGTSTPTSETPAVPPVTDGSETTETPEASTTSESTEAPPAPKPEVAPSSDPKPAPPEPSDPTPASPQPTSDDSTEAGATEPPPGE